MTRWRAQARTCRFAAALLMTAFSSPRGVASAIQSDPAGAEGAHASQLAEQVAAERRLVRGGGDRQAAARHRERVLRLIADSDRLLKGDDDDTRRAAESAERAQDILFELIINDAAFSHVLYGIAFEDEVQQVSGDLKLLEDAIIASTGLIQRAIEAVHAKPNESKDAEAHRARLGDLQTLLEGKLEFLAGVSTSLRCVLQDAAVGNAACTDAAQRLGGVRGLLSGRAAVLAGQYEGLARARMGEFDRAEELFRTVATDPAALPADIFWARMNGVLNRMWNRSPSEALVGVSSVREKTDQQASPYYRLLLAESACAIRLTQARSMTGPRAADGVNAAVAEMAPMLRSAAGLADANQLAAWTDEVLARLSRALEPVHPEGLSPLARLARAQGQRAAGQTQAAGMQIESVLAQPDLNPHDRGLALWMLGRLHEPTDLSLCGRSFLMLAENFPRDPRAELAMMRSLELLYGEAEPGKSPNSEADLIHAIETALAKYPQLPDLDRWRLIYADHAIRTADLAKAENLLAAVHADSPWGAEGWLLHARLSGARAREQPDGPTRRYHLERQINASNEGAKLIQQLLARTIDASRRLELERVQHRLTLERVRAQIMLGQHKAALELLASLDATAVADSSSRITALELRYTAHLHQKESSEAAHTLQRVLLIGSPAAWEAALKMVDEAAVDLAAVQWLPADDEGARAVRDRLQPVVSTAVQWMNDHHGDDAAIALLLIKTGDAARLIGEAGMALELFDRAAVHAGDTLDVLLGRAECLYALGAENQLAMAMTMYKRISAAREDVISGDAYWLSQLRMVQILEKTGRNTSQIAPRIELLRRRDPHLGGDRFQLEFNRLSSKFGPSWAGN